MGLSSREARARLARFVAMVPYPGSIRRYLSRTLLRRRDSRSFVVMLAFGWVRAARVCDLLVSDQSMIS